MAVPTTPYHESNNLELGDSDKKSSAYAPHDDRVVPAAGDAKHDAVFGEIHEGGPDYRAVHWLSSSVLMAKAQIGLGVLGIPSVFATLGIVPGIICLLAVAFITTSSNIFLAHFKQRHPELYSVDDIGYILFGRIGREVFAVFYVLFMVAVAGSAINGISVALNAISLHGTCTVVFAVVAALLAFLTASIPTLGKISYLGWIGMISILIALMTLTISVAVQGRPADAPADWVKNIQVVAHPGFNAAIGAIGTLVFAFAGLPSVCGIIQEQRDPRLFARAMYLCNGVATNLYILVGVVVYYYAEEYVANPALGTAGPLMKRVCYGMAIPGLLMSACLYGHLPAKYIWIRALGKNSRHITSNTFIHWASWLSCVAGCVTISLILAQSIPTFGNIVGLVGALLGTFLCFQVGGFMALRLYWKDRSASTWNKVTVYYAIFVIVIGFFIQVAGTYGTIVDIAATYARGVSKVWSCADNSNSV